MFLQTGVKIILLVAARGTTRRIHCAEFEVDFREYRAPDDKMLYQIFLLLQPSLVQCTDL